MTRTIFNFAAVLSLLMTLAAGLLWLISLWKSFGFEAKWTTGLPNSYGETPVLCTFQLEADRGSLALYLWRDYRGIYFDPSTGRMDPVRRTPVAFTGIYRRAEPGRLRDIGGRWINLYRRARSTDHMVTIRVASAPTWAFAILFGLLPASRAMHRLRQSRRKIAGYCPRCGYDLRASKERCPECGTLITATSL